MARRTGLVAILAIVGAAMLGVLASVSAADGGKSRSVEAKLTGYEETPLTLSTPARGKIKLKIRNSTSIEYKLSYSNIATAVTMAHIHFGMPAITGGISAWLCDSATNPAPTPPAGTPDDVPVCPPAPTSQKVTVTGTITAGDVVGPANQGIAPTEIAELIAAIKFGAAYANVHSAQFGGGEIRAQLGGRDDDDD